MHATHHTDARVWAPRATSVELHRERDGEIERVPMLPDGDGWFVALAALAVDDRYGFVLDDAQHPVPDPRSRRQPDGVHDLSALDDPSAFAWSDEHWTGRQLAGSVIYEVHIGTFTPEGTVRRRHRPP